MRSDLPSGTVTFLFTDVEGSTKLLHELGAEGYADALAEHRRLIREACAAEGGVEVDTQGDAFFFAFPTAPGALAAADAMTQTLASGPIQVRMGLHTGTPLVTDEGYVGGDVHRVARIAAAGHGGQVLVSTSTAQLVDLELRDLGEHRFKDLAAPERVYQLGDGDFPPLASLYRTNLPIPATAFLGRERELADVVALLDSARLLTLTGPGGTGKTRLALQAAGQTSDGYPEGVYWVGLAVVRDPQLVVPTIARAVEARGELMAHVSDRRVLLLLDNFEQVVGAAPELPPLLAACPNLRLIVTSRELLRVAGEVEYQVPPLAGQESVELFCGRSRLQPDASIAELCRRLDNLPLAVELAAARTSVLSPQQILERLSQRLDLLKGGRDADPRQATLRATIEWSYESLTAEEQQLLVRLSVFVGGCTLEAAEEVCDADVDRLQSLVEKSLLRFTDGRYWLLETIRVYAAEQLTIGEAEEVRQRHAEHYAQVGERAEETLTSQRDAVQSLLSADVANVRAAYGWAEEQGSAERLLQLAKVAGWFGPPLNEWLRWMTRALTSASAVSEARAKVLERAGFVTRQTGDLQQAATLFEDALAVYRTLGNESGIASAFGGLGDVAVAEGRLPEARALYEDELRVFRRLEERRGVYESLRGLGEVERELGNLHAARELLRESVALAEAETDSLNVARGAVALAAVELDTGEIEAASALYREALSVPRENIRAHCLVGLSAVAARQRRGLRAGQLWGAAEHLQETLGFEVRRVERERALAAVAALADSSDFERGINRGRSMSSAECLTYALSDID